MKNYDLGTDKIGRLVRHFSVPCVISMLVAALYNIVDQIFIGWSPAGAFGNAATNIVYPFTVLALGLSLLVGDGAAANFSLESGRKNKDRADKSVGNGFLLLIIFSILLCLMGFIFKSQILKLFGANPEEKVCYDFAVQYFTVICAGLPFYMIGQGMNASIRADGSPKYAMAAYASLRVQAANGYAAPPIPYMLCLLSRKKSRKDHSAIYQLLYSWIMNMFIP